MRKHERLVGLTHWSHRMVGWLGLAAIVAALWLTQSGRTEARLQPYYVVNGSSFGQINPRVLFVLDTSGSMSLQADATNTLCAWWACENPAEIVSGRESRISSARRAVQNVVAGIGESAKFALMTFEQHGPPSSTPDKCNDYGEETRFVFASHYTYWFGSGAPTFQDIIRDVPGYYQGAMRLCSGDDRRPWAYLRWDDLGVGSIIPSNNQAGTVPDSPLIDLAFSVYPSLANYRRRVQFFPEFMGVRVRLDATTDPGGTIAAATVGDFSTTEVTNNDFYYWPYVDGFPGYGNWGVYDDSNSPFSGAANAGVAGEDGMIVAASLYAPFYMGDLSGAGIPPAQWGPASPEQGINDVLQGTAPLISGGVDAVGGTPWSSVIGAVPGTATLDNSIQSHGSVASYLAFATSVDLGDACAPTSAILLTDGEPSPAVEGGTVLYQRLSALRRDLGVRTYVVGFFLTGTALNNMACAATGVCDGGSCSDPCGLTAPYPAGAPPTPWDTCRTDASECAYLATSAAELEAILAGIIADAVDIPVASGPGATVNETNLNDDLDGTEAENKQTEFRAYTDFPGWKGHVAREVCRDTVDAAGTLADYCDYDPLEFEDPGQETFGPCPLSRDWDAGVCLRDTDWRDRRIYSYSGNNTVFRISEPDGSASVGFQNELQLLGLTSSSAEADAVARFLLEGSVDENWKLPGVANSSPITVRRVPRFDRTRVPEVALNDGHCSGRFFTDLDRGALPDTLEDFADAAWDDTLLLSPGSHYEYQEAVLIGDDFGILHAFHLNSGNELWGLLPRPLLESAVAQANNGATNMGQPDTGLEDHIYGIATTVNHSYAYDPTPGVKRWRDLAVFGFGVGGTDLVAIDISHMSPSSPREQFDLLWTTEDTAGGRNVQYDQMLGETWARPTLAYHVVGDTVSSNEPASFVVFGSGYVDGTGAAEQGRVLVTANAITGDILETFEFPAPTGAIDGVEFGTVVDAAVGTHCLSRYWPEAQETYIADPAGRLFRVDLKQGDGLLEFSHEADSGVDWSVSSPQPLVTFQACMGTGSSCSVSAGNPGDVFTFGPAVSANDRLDDAIRIGSGDVVENDQFLIAMISGNPSDAAVDGGDAGNTFHSSLYLMVDDHSSPADARSGLNVPAGGTKLAVGSLAASTAVLSNSDYVRIALSDIYRERRLEPFPGAPEIVSTGNFSPEARPVRAPRILVTGVQDGGDALTDIEVYYVSYFVYEPGSGTCDPRFYDTANETWYVDRGSTYELTFRLTADSGSGFDFAAGSTNAGVDLGAGFQRGLVLESVTQVVDDTTCPGGNCGATPGAEGSAPCNPNAVDPSTTAHSFAVSLSNRRLPGFTPVE